jgi:glycosyltransferase involved in cell wall biosynthesis
VAKTGGLDPTMIFSVVTTNRNRLEHLRQTLPTWQRQPSISEIIVVDYGSERPITTADLPTEKVRIVRVEGTDAWRLGHAINIGVDHATNQNICKFDSDVLIENGEWLASVNLREASVFRGGVAGEWLPSVKSASDSTTLANKRSSTGQLIFLKAQWQSVGGYNEWCSGYGFEDFDFYFRLRSTGVSEHYFPPSLIRMLPHSQDLRGSYDNSYRFMRINDPQTRAAIDQLKNTLLAFMRRWDVSLRVPYSVLPRQGGIITVKTEPVRGRYRFEDTISEGIASLFFMTADPQTKRQIDGMLMHMINECGGFAVKSEN